MYTTYLQAGASAFIGTWAQAEGGTVTSQCHHLTRLQGLARRGSQRREKSSSSPGIHLGGTPVTSTHLPLAKQAACTRLTSRGQEAYASYPQVPVEEGIQKYW